MGIFSDTQGQLTTLSFVESSRNPNSYIHYIMIVLLTCKDAKDPVKNKQLEGKDRSPERIYLFMKGITKHSYTQNIKALGLMVSEKKIFFIFPHYNPMGAICCHGIQSYDPTWPKT